jgi:hypothetical protein
MFGAMSSLRFHAAGVPAFYSLDGWHEALPLRKPLFPALKFFNARRSSCHRVSHIQQAQSIAACDGLRQVMVAVF